MIHLSQVANNTHRNGPEMFPEVHIVPEPMPAPALMGLVGLLHFICWLFLRVGIEILRRVAPMGRGALRP
jgi:hypothetical protein